MLSSLAQHVGSHGSRPLKIDIVVHGRFHGFALARALLAQGHDVLVHTNYPAPIVARFGVARRHVRTFLLHGLGSRALQKLGGALSRDRRDRWLHTSFGAWAARSVRPDCDFVHGFTGVMEEYLVTPRALPHQVRTIVRGSAHIREQARLLEEEEMRAGVPLDRPSAWMIEREEREYALADKIFVLSTFAKDSFTARGIAAERLWMTPLGVDVRQFGATPEVREARLRRIRSGQALRVLTVGTFSFQKGIYDLVAVASALSKSMHFRFVGAQAAEAYAFLRTAAEHLDLVERVPESGLAEHYGWADIFLFPTIQDGFAAVLLQAAASGLPIVATANCSAPDFILNNRTGWIVDARNATAMIERLRWCNNHRGSLAEIVKTAGAIDYTRTWDDMARQMVSLWYDAGLEKSVAVT